MIMTLAIGAVTSISLFVALMFFVNDIDAVRDASLPSLELVYQMYPLSLPDLIKVASN